MKITIEATSFEELQEFANTIVTPIQDKIPEIQVVQETESVDAAMKNLNDVEPEPTEEVAASTEEVEDDIDAEGLPWDARIHSTAKSKTAKGVWKILRKPKKFESEEDWKAYIDSVKFELRSVPNDEDTSKAIVFNDLLQLITSNSAVITLNEVTAICQQHDIRSLPEVASYQERIPTIYADIEAFIRENS